MYLNGQLVVDRAIMENYWDRKRPLYPKGSIQLQTHGGEIRWRNIFVREIPAAGSQPAAAARRAGICVAVQRAGSQRLARRRWTTTKSWTAPFAANRTKGGTLFTKEQYDNFVARLEFRLPPGGNNGLAIRYPGEGDPAYAGMCELQVLDSPRLSRPTRSPPGPWLRVRYGGGARGYLRPVGEWNYQEVTVQGSKIKVELNGTVILDTDLSEVKEFMADHPHPGLKLPKGYFGFAGHSDPVEFRNIAIKPLTN